MRYNVIETVDALEAFGLNGIAWETRNEHSEQKNNHELSTVEPRLSSNWQLLSKQQDLAKASEVTEVQFLRASSISTFRFFTYWHCTSSGELVRKTSKFISPITNKIAN